MQTLEEQRIDFMRRQAEGMRALSEAEVSERIRADMADARQRGPLTSEELKGMQNFWGATSNEQNAIIPNAPSTLWLRMKRRFLGI